MKKSTLLFALLAFSSGSFAQVQISAQNPSVPPKTVMIKNPAADNTVAFFSGSTNYFFEVYQAGSKEEVTKMKKTFEKDPAVQSLAKGALTGDYQAFTLTLKSPKNKEWFSKTFRGAGLNNIRINRGEIMPVEKM